jgi:glycosyltransferase involved in cell wall biosynthesis
MNHGSDTSTSACVKRQPIRVMRIITRMNIGGPALHVALLTAGLNGDDFKSTLVAGAIVGNEGDMTDFACGMGVRPLILSPLRRQAHAFNDTRALVSLWRLMRRERPHIVHTHTAKAGFLGRLAARLSGVPVVIHTFHGHVFRGYFGAAQTQIYLAMERLAARLSDLILTPGERIRTDLLRFQIAPPEKIKVVPLGLPLDNLVDITAYRGRLRRDLGFSANEKLVGIVGRLVPIKRHEVFLEAARVVADRAPQTRFVIVGDGERRFRLETLARDLGLGDSVRFTGWRRDLPLIYADLDALVMSSSSEGTPVSIIEALAAGVPVVSTSVGGVPDLLREGEFGRLVPPENPQALAVAMLEAFENKSGPDLARAKEWAHSHYSSGRLIEDMRALYRTLCDDLRRRHAKRESQDGSETRGS